MVIQHWKRRAGLSKPRLPWTKDELSRLVTALRNGCVESIDPNDFPGRNAVGIDRQARRLIAKGVLQTHRFAAPQHVAGADMHGA